ncbi:MAG: hypothetical protein JWS10_2924 [Cypionkella sp.]|nr:hypothetical protein [Cypionkella sp.]
MDLDVADDTGCMETKIKATQKAAEKHWPNCESLARLPYEPGKGDIKMTDATASNPALPRQPYRSSLVSGRKTVRFTFAPDVAERRLIAAALDLIDLPEFTYKGELSPAGRADVVLRADLSALVVQPCSVTLAPVHSRLADTTERRYAQEFAESSADELEIPDEDIEALPEVIDVAAVAIEALALALPLYPRARGAEFTEAAFAAPGVTPLKSEDLKPFAGLAALASKLKKPEEPEA